MVLASKEGDKLRGRLSISTRLRGPSKKEMIAGNKGARRGDGLIDQRGLRRTLVKISLAPPPLVKHHRTAAKRKEG